MALGYALQMLGVSSKQPVKVDMLHILLSLLVLCYGVTNSHCSAVNESSQDLLSLLDFKQGITSDPRGALRNWTMSSHFCHWNGVTCTLTRPYRLQWLNLTGQSLSGQISSSLGNLTFLNYLDLSYNNFVGPLPLLGGLQHLQHMYLNNNNFSGVIPEALTNCSKLTALDVSSNILVGSISQKLGILSNLTYLNLKSNQLEGTIPHELGQLVKLESLLLGDNRLSGEIPHPIFNISSLQYLYLHMNFLGKELPPNIGEILPNLIELTLESNMFEGPIPASLGNALEK
jgi:Leucine-rich repeat (LRR) protein